MKTIYHNGQVYTGTLPLVQAFAVEDGKFTAAGCDAELLAAAAPGDETVDLAGRFVCSGFNDSHMHLLNFGYCLGVARLDENTGSLAEMLDCLRRFLAENPPAPGEWLVGRGWNQDYFSDCARMPDRWDLDAVSAEVPILAERACGHALVVNSKALELLGVTADTPQPEGGAIGLADGQPDGRFYDNAIEMVWAKVPGPGAAQVKEMLLTACRALSAYGVTSCQTDDYGFSREIPWQTINEAYRELAREGLLTVRVNEQCNFADPAALREFIAAGNVTGVGDEMFRVGPLKMLGDGSLGARTAFLTKPYADDPSTCGLAVFSQETLDEMIGIANENGMQVAIHAIGDGCLDRVLNAVEKALAQHPRTDHRHGIVHCQITRADQLERICRLKMHVYAQTIFLDYDTHIVEQRVGKALADTSYSWKTLMRGGVCVSNGTDCPVELPDALAGIQCAVTRTTLRNHVGPYLPAQAFTVQEALDSYTRCGARASFEEAVKGCIAPGMLADFLVLDGNPFACKAEELHSIPVVSTWVGGKKVYG